MVEVVFALKEGSWLLNFITEDNLRAFRLALGGNPQVALVVSPFTATPLPAIGVSLDAVASPISGFSVV